VTNEGASSMIKASALVVGGVYAYRRFTEGTAEELKASTTIAPLGQFLVGWGLVFFSLSVIAPAAPSLAGHIALLLMLASLLANGVQVSKDVQAGLRKPAEEREKLLHPKQRRGAGGGSGTVSHPPPFKEASA
jgi:hypothetical protein